MNSLAGFSPIAIRNFCILPALGLLISFNAFPLLASLVVSFTEYNPIIDSAPQYVGWRNYLDLLNSPRDEVWAAFARTGALVVFAVGLQTVLGFGLALLLQRRFYGQGVLVSLLLIPMMLSPAIMGSFWRYMLNADYGVINWLLDSSLSWGGSTPLAFWGVVLAETWMWTPFMLLLSLAGLQSIPPSLYEAAAVDRAGAWFRFRHITLPLVLPMLLLGIVFRAMDTFRLFDTAMVMNGNLEGQPTTFVSVLLHSRGFGGSLSLGDATALAYLLLVVAIALSVLVLRLLERVREARH